MRRLLRFAWAVIKQWSSLAGLCSTALTYILLYFAHLRIPQWLPVALLAGGLLISFLLVGTAREKQIDQLVARLSAETKRTEDAENLIRRLEEENKKLGRGQSKWRPFASIESIPPENFLVLKSDREFKIDRVSILASNGAVLSEILLQNSEMLRSKGYRVPLPQDKITKFWNESGSGPRTGSASGTLRVEASHDDDSATLSVPFIAKQEFHSNTAWVKLTG